MPGPRGENLLSISNEAIRIGIDAHYGGAITHLSRADAATTNLVNLFDMGRQIQQSYYSGPAPYGVSHPEWPAWPWNPIGAGDVYGHASTVLDVEASAEALHVRSVPLQWALDGVPGECTFDTWIRLDGNTARVRNRLTNHRSDTTAYPARHQELPAVYTIGLLHHLVTYDGLTPFTGGPTTEIVNDGPPWDYWTATECWAALVDDSGWGVGVVHPGAMSFVGGFHGVRGAGGPHDPATGYVSPLHNDVLDHDITYDYEYVLVLGSVEDVRRTATSERLTDPFTFTFAGDRAHWTPVDAADRPAADRGRLVAAHGPDPGYMSPVVCWEASDVTEVVLIGETLGQERAPVRLRWRCHGQSSFPPDQVVDMRPDDAGGLRARVGEHPLWTGTVASLRLDLPLHDQSMRFRLESLHAGREPAARPS